MEDRSILDAISTDGLTDVDKENLRVAESVITSLDIIAQLKDRKALARTFNTLAYSIGMYNAQLTASDIPPDIRLHLLLNMQTHLLQNK